MTNYVHTSDGETIDNYHLPASIRLSDGRTVSNAAGLHPAVLAAEGWLPLVQATPDPGPEEMVARVSYIVHADRVDCVREIVATPDPGPVLVDARDDIAARFGSGVRVLYVTGTEQFVVLRVTGDPQPRRLFITMPGVDGPIVCDCLMIPDGVSLLDVQAVAAAGVHHIETVTRPALQAGTLDWEPLPDEVLADVVAALVEDAAVAAAVTAATGG